MTDNLLCRKHTFSLALSMDACSKYIEIDALNAMHTDFHSICARKCRKMVNLVPIGHLICRPVRMTRSKDFARQMFGKLSSINARRFHGDQPPLTGTQRICVCVIFHPLACARFSLASRRCTQSLHTVRVACGLRCEHVFDGVWWCSCRSTDSGYSLHKHCGRKEKSYYVASK